MVEKCLSLTVYKPTSRTNTNARESTTDANISIRLVTINVLCVIRPVSSLPVYTARKNDPVSGQ